MLKAIRLLEEIDVPSIYRSKRFKIYPAVSLLVCWSVVAINIFTRNGWQGGFGQIIGSDFITLYSAGWLYRHDIQNLYNFEVQNKIQQQLIWPTTLKGTNPFISPPYVALAYSFFTYFPLVTSFIIMLITIILFVLLLIPLLMKLLQPSSTALLITRKKVLILILSFFPMIFGWQAGQNHTLTLLLITAVLVFFLEDKPTLAGFAAGLLIYKPQYVLGWLILWIIWRDYRALLSFGLVTALWIGISLLQIGFAPYMQYLETSPLILNLPYTPGFPGYLQITSYGLLATLLPEAAAPLLQKAIYGLMLIFGLGLAMFAYRTRFEPASEKYPVIVMAVLYPLVASPYALFHDLVILFPVIFLWSRYAETRLFLLSILLFYFGGLFLPTISYLIQVAIMAIIPIVYLFAQVQSVFRSNRINVGMLER